MKEVEKYHLLTSPITDEVFIGTIRKKESEGLDSGHCVSENKVNRTDEFNASIINLYENCSWHITKTDAKGKKIIYYCCVLDEEKLRKNKDKTIGEFFKLNGDEKNE